MVSGRDQRHVAGEHQHMREALQRAARLHHGVSGAELLRLQHEVDPGGPQCSPTRSASCPMMAKMFCGATTRLAAATTCASKRLSGDLVQDLGMARFEPRAFSGSKNGDGERVW